MAYQSKTKTPAEHPFRTIVKLLDGEVLPRVLVCHGHEEFLVNWAQRYVKGKLIEPAAEALDYGLVAEVYDDIAALREKEEELALELASKAPITMKLDKRLIYDAAGKQPTDIAQRDAMTLGFLFTTRDAREGLRAFLEKRKPVYENR